MNEYGYDKEYEEQLELMYMTFEQMYYDEKICSQNKQEEE